MLKVDSGQQETQFGEVLLEKQPVVGDIVLYHVGAFDGPEIRHNHTEDEDLPAIVVRAWSETCVNLKIFTDGPTDAWKTSVVLGEKPGEWSWPIMQVIVEG